MVSFPRQFLLLLAVTFALVTLPPARAVALDALTKSQEQAALRFARQHHPELSELLKQLDREMTAEYDKAIRQIHVVNVRLERVKDRSPEDYKLQLELWKIESRIQLLAAHMTMSSDEQLQAEMQKLLDQKFTLKEQQLRREQERTEVRLKRVTSQLEAIENHREELLKKELARYRRLQPTKTTPTSTKNKNTTKKSRKP